MSQMEKKNLNDGKKIQPTYTQHINIVKQQKQNCWVDPFSAKCLAHTLYTSHNIKYVTFNATIIIIDVY